MSSRPGLPGFRLVAGAAALALAATACGAGNGGKSAADQPVRVELTEPEHELVPTNTAETQGAEVLNALFVGLVRYDKDNRPVNRIAESITTSDNKTWMIKLKGGYTFHNGEPVTAKSFVDAWNYGANQDNAQEAQAFFSRIQGFADLAPGEGKKPKAKTLQGLKVIDDKTFKVTLSQPFSQFMVMLGYTAFYPVPKAFFADPKAFGAKPIGNGPFQMETAWKRGTATEIKLTRYDNFTEGKAKVRRVSFKLYTSLETAYNDLRAGNLDIMDTLPATVLGSARAELGDRFISKPHSGVGYIGFPISTNPQFKSPGVRKAISMAIDRRTISDKVFNGGRVPADDFINPLVQGYRKGACGEACTLDPQKAKQLYRSAGGPARLDLGYNADGGHKEWIEAVANDLRTNLGVQVTVKPFEQWSKILSELSDRKWKGPFRMGWVMDYPAAENYLKPIFGTEAIQTGSNYGGYSNPRFDALVRQGDTAKTPEAGLAFYRKAADLLISEMPYIPIYFYRTTAGFSKNVKNVSIDVFDRIELRDVEHA